MVATRFAYGTALAKLAEHNSRVIALDGDTKNSTYSDRIKKVIDFIGHCILTFC
jgi:transketolase